MWGSFAWSAHRPLLQLRSSHRMAATCASDTRALETLAESVLRAGGQTQDAYMTGRALVGRLVERHGATLVTESAVRQACARMLRGVPLSVACGIAHFRDATLECTGVLCPRADSEVLVEAALPHCRDACVDLGTGSGALLIALLQARPVARGVGVDRCAKAVAVATRNGQCNGVGERSSFLVADWTERRLPVAPSSCVVWNPPYLRSEDARRMLYDPVGALDGGFDGLDCYRHAPWHWVAPKGGVLIAEIGAGQLDDVVALVTARGAAAVLSVHHDLQRIARAVVFKRTHD